MHTNTNNINKIYKRMKKQILWACTVVVALLMGACNEDDMFGSRNGNSVTFNVGVPELASTRAVGDGFTANRLYWGVYDHNNQLLPDISNTTVDNKEDMQFAGSGTVTLTLAKDKKYSIIFWAANADSSMCTVDWEARTMTVAPQFANLEAYDAFCKYEVIDNVSGYMTRDIKLKRPFAQINIGTADIAKAAASGLTVQNTKVQIAGLHTTYDFVTGESEGDATFGYNYPVKPVSFDGEKFPVEDDKYDYLSMNYALISADKKLVDVTFTYIDDDAQEHTRTYSAVPVQRNWRTNIYGNILTSEADFKVTIVPEFADVANPDSVHNIEVWDGKTVDAPQINEAEKTVTIATGNQLAWLAASVNGTLGETLPANSYAGWTILLDENIDLGGEEWTQIGGYAKHFEGSFDGQGHTISNFKITKKSINQAALFGSIAGTSTIKNFTVDSVRILYPGVDAGDFYGAAVVGTTYGNHTFQDINVKNSTIQGNNKVAGLIAHDGVSSAITITNCHVSDCTIETKNEQDGGNVGGLIGFLQTKDVVISNSSVKNCVFNAINSSNAGKRGNSQFIGAIHGEKALTIVDCAVEGNTFNETGLVSYRTPYDKDFIGGARYETTANVIINGTLYMKVLPDEPIILDENTSIVLRDINATNGITISGTGTLILDGVTIETTEGAAITLADGANVTLELKEGVTLTGATSAITVPAGATLTLKGEEQSSSLAPMRTRSASTEDASESTYTFVGKAGSGIGGAGTIVIENLAGIKAVGTGVHAFGIGGNGANVTINNSTVDYACGGHIQPLFVNDSKYGKNEPEGGAAIGGDTIKIEGSTITKADGGSKAAAIGAQYHQSTDIEIVNSTITEANGGNASAGIGGSRYSSNISAENKQSTIIRIENSTVTATGGQAGAGIGSGYDTHCAANDVNAVNDITIINSTVTAQGGKYAAGIGTGFHAAALTGSIDDASIINATSGENFYKDAYTTAQNIGYGVVDPAREFAGASVTFTVEGKVIEHPVGFFYDDAKEEYNVTSAQGLEKVLEQAGAAGAGDTKINITSDLNMTGVEWTPIEVDGYHGADIVTIDGNYNTITGLTAPLFAGGFAGGSGIVIKNLTIDASTIVSTNETGSGAFVESSDSQAKIYLENCHLKNSSVTGSRTGGLVGWTSGYSNVNDGPVKTYVTLLNCSVDKCTITGTSVGGLNGHAGASDWTYTTIENCSVTNCNLVSTDDGGWRVGVAVGTANVGEVTITNLTESGNTLTQTGKTAPTGEKRNYYGRFVPGTTGKLIIDGVTYVVDATNLKNAVAAGATNLYLQDGEYKVTGCGGKTLTINGSKDAVLKLTNQGEDGCDYGFGSAGTGVGNYTFNGVTINTAENTGNYKGYAYMKGTFNNCSFVGAYSLNNANDFVFNNCTFNFNNGYLWTWGAKSATFAGCTFNGNGKCILAHGSAATVININDCTFAATEAGYTWDGNQTAVVEIDPTGTNTYTINFTGINTKTDAYAGWYRIKDGTTGHTVTGIQ